jgi:hypothetical protein
MRGHITHKCDQYKSKLIERTTLNEFIKKYKLHKIECITVVHGSSTLNYIFHGKMKYSFSLGFYGLSLIELAIYNGTVVAQYRDVKKTSDGKIQIEAPLNYVTLTDSYVIMPKLYSHKDEAISKGFEMLDTLFCIKIGYYKEKLADLQILAKEMSLLWSKGELILDDEELKPLVDILRKAILYEMKKETQLYNKYDFVW